MISKDEKYVVIMGNEVDGVSDEALALCDGFIEIPQLGTKHSLNVSVCAGIIMWEFLKSEIMEFPVLETERLILRQLTLADAEDMFEYFSQDEVTEYYDLYTFKGIDEAEKLIQDFNKNFEYKKESAGQFS